MIQSFKKRVRKCCVCRSIFEPRSMSHKACSIECAAIHAKSERERKDRKETKAKLDSMKTKRDYLKIAQQAFNAWVRARDSGQPCICCGQPLGTFEGKGGAYDAGHYRSCGSAPHLRFNPDNCHAQRKQCNSWGAGRAVDYRIGLIARIGLERVEALESDNEPKKYTIEQLKEIAALYRKKLKEIT